MAFGRPAGPRRGRALRDAVRPGRRLQLAPAFLVRPTVEEPVFVTALTRSFWCGSLFARATAARQRAVDLERFAD